VLFSAALRQWAVARRELHTQKLVAGIVLIYHFVFQWVRESRLIRNAPGGSRKHMLQSREV
jgi:hypothetical protein